MIVEIDEALLGKKKSSAIGNDNPIQKIWVLGAAERAANTVKSMRFWVVPNRTKVTIHPILQKNINKYSYILSDGLFSYKGLGSKF